MRPSGRVPGGLGRRTVPRILTALILAWTLFVVFFYFQSNPVLPSVLSASWIKPFLQIEFHPAAFLLRTVDTGWGVILLLLITVLAQALGRILTDGLMSVRLWAWHAELAVRISLGLGILAMLIYGLGLVGLLSPVCLWAFPAAGAVCAVRVLVRISLQDRSRRVYDAVRRYAQDDPFGLPALALAVLLCLVLVPSPEIEYDSLNYHLAMPQAYLLVHRFIPVPYDFTSFHPFLSEMLYTLSLGLGVPLVAKGVNAVFYLLLLLLLAGTARGISPRFALSGAGLLAAVPVIAVTAGALFTDLNLAFWQFLLLVCLFRFRAERRLGSLPEVLLLGVIASLALGTKWTAAVSAGVCLAVLTVPALRPERERVGWLAPVLFTTVILALTFPWTFKNMVWAGNPFFPFLYPVFGGVPWSADIHEQVMRVCARYVPHLRDPWDAVLFVRDTCLLHRGAIHEVSQGLMFLVLFPAALTGISRRAPAGARTAVALAMLLPIPWVLASHDPRFLLPVYPWFCLAGVWALERTARLWESAGGGGLRTAWRCIVGVLLVVGAVLCWQQAGKTYQAPAAVIAGIEQVPDYLDRALPLNYSRAMRVVGTVLPPGARVWVIGDDRTYYLNVRSIHSAIYYPLLGEIVEGCVDLTALEQRLRRLGVTHILYNRRYAFYIQDQNQTLALAPAEMALWAEFWRRRVRIVWNLGREWCLAEIVAPDPRRRADLRFLPGVEERLTLMAQRAEADGRSRDAVREYRSALTIVPDLVTAHERLAWLYLEAGDRVSARRAMALAYRYGSDLPRGPWESALQGR